MCLDQQRLSILLKLSHVIKLQAVSLPNGNFSIVLVNYFDNNVFQCGNNDATKPDI